MSFVHHLDITFKSMYIEIVERESADNKMSADSFVSSGKWCNNDVILYYFDNETQYNNRKYIRGIR